MKKLFLIMIMLFSWLFAISENSFVLNIINNENPLKEIDGLVVMQFDSEYELLIKNENNRDCTAKIWIDGTLVSSFSDFIIRAGDEFNLERFVTESMDEGQRFKFVPLDNPEVDDPYRVENGVVKVEFRLEKQYIIIMPEPSYPYWLIDGSTTTLTSNSINCSSSAAGATIGGSDSDQSFAYSSIDLEDETTILELKIRGI